MTQLRRENIGPGVLLAVHRKPGHIAGLHIVIFLRGGPCSLSLIPKLSKHGWIISIMMSTIYFSKIWWSDQPDRTSRDSLPDKRDNNIQINHCLWVFPLDYQVKQDYLTLKKWFVIVFLSSPLGALLQNMTRGAVAMDSGGVGCPFITGLWFYLHTNMSVIFWVDKWLYIVNFAFDKIVFAKMNARAMYSSCVKGFFHMPWLIWRAGEFMLYESCFQLQSTVDP